MNSISKIKNRIASLLQNEIEKSNAEIEELQLKQHENMASYGIGDPYNRYENAIARRRTHIKELESIQTAQGCAVILEPLHMYGYFCPLCSEKIYLTGRNPNTVECPICTRRIYSDGVIRNGTCKRTVNILVYATKFIKKGAITCQQQNSKSNVATANIVVEFVLLKILGQAFPANIWTTLY